MLSSRTHRLQISPTSLLFLTLLTWQGSEGQVHGTRCYADADRTCGQDIIPSAETPRQCCIENPRGLSYDYGGQAEKCFKCEVVGWMETPVYTTENSTVELRFGVVRGVIGVAYSFRIEFSGNANINAVSDVSNLVLITSAMTVSVWVPRLPAGSRPPVRNTTLQLVSRPVPGRDPLMDEQRFLHPAEVILHVIVPQVQFEESQYSLQFPGSSVSVCLMYSNTENGGFVQFEAEILIAREGGHYSQREVFSFTSTAGRLCRNISVSRSELTPFTDTVFSAEIVAESEAVFELGAESSASITVQALQAPNLEFESTDYTVSSADSTIITVCLMYSATDAIYAPFDAEVALTKEGSHVLTQSFTFTDVDSRSCQNIAIESLQPNQFGDTVFDVTIVVIPDSTYVLGDVASARLTVQGREAPRVEIEHSRYILLPSPLSLCLLYHNAEDGQYAQFSVEVEVTKQDGGVVQSLRYEFTEVDSRSCMTLTIPSYNLNEFGDTVFVARIDVLPGSVFELGVVSSATITAEGKPVTTEPPDKEEDETDKTDKEEDETDKEEEETDRGSGKNQEVDKEDVSLPVDDSESPSWVIAVAVVIPVLLIAIVVVVVLIAALMYYKRHHYMSYDVSKSEKF